MKEISEEFLLFNKISNKITKINYMNEKQAEGLEKLINFYIKKYGEQGDCLVNKLNIFKDVKKIEY